MSLLYTQAIVLKGMDLGEADRLVTMFTREKGKMRIAANGVRRTRSTLSALVQPFTYNSIVVYMGSSIPRLRQGEILDSFLSLQGDLLTVVFASYLAELIDHFLADEDKQEPVFNLFLLALKLLKEKGPQELILRTFELHLLSLLGYQPHMANCVKCNEPAWYEENMFFSIGQGGLKCKACTSSLSDRKIKKGTAEAMIKLMSSPLMETLNYKIPPEDMKEMEEVIVEYIVYRTEKELKSLSLLGTLS